MTEPRIFALETNTASLVLERRGDGSVVWRHFGLRANSSDIPPLAATRTSASFSLDADIPAQLFPPAGLGWFGPAAMDLRRSGAACVFQATAGEVREEPGALTIVCRDGIAGVEAEQRIEIGAGGTFRFSALVRNVGEGPLAVEALASAAFPLPATSVALVSWRGRHNAEMAECSEPMPQHSWRRETRRGLTGHGGPPGAYVLGEGATYHAGEVHALQLAWSGNARLEIERGDEGDWSVSAAAVLAPGEVVLAPGGTHCAPVCIVAVSDAGRNGAASGFHAAVRALTPWPGSKMRPRPVHFNSWEAVYFDHDEARIGDLAEAAAAVGAERFILDDGWFAGRSGDHAGLGDWIPDPVKYPRGLAPLAGRINALGMEFGLWVEPEMVNPDSDLYRAHPDWALHLPGRPQPTGRGQLVLDMARADVRDYLFAALDTLLREAPIAYLKWDHNRDLAPGASAAQVLGTYDLLARLHAAHPAVEIESCAGGGGRTDAGIAANTHRFWTSDNIDAVSRVPIQRGFLAFLPPELMGAHVGASPAHVTGRSQRLDFRAAVALPGHFGIELDPRRLSERDRAKLAGWTAFYKEWRNLLHYSTVHLGEGADGLVWQAHDDGNEALLFAVRSDAPRDRRPQPLRLPFAADFGACRVRLLRIAGGSRGWPNHSAAWFEALKAEGAVLDGSWLARAGLPLPPLKAETVAIFHLARKP